MPKLVWFNGKITPLEEAVIPVGDHAHLYGDGIFEGIRIYNRRVYKLDPHLERLYHGMTFLGFHIPMPLADLKATILEVCKQADLSDGYIRLNVTRGTGLGLDPKNIGQSANLMIMINTLALFPKEMYDRGLNAITSSLRVIPADSIDPRLKCIGRYANNILAKFEANKKGADEALMLNHQGLVAECTGENIFLVQGNVLKTPHSSCGILEGVTRNSIIALAKKAGMEVREDFLSIFDIFCSDEVFLCGTGAEIISFCSLDGRLIGNGKPGSTTKKLENLFKESTTIGDAF